MKSPGHIGGEIIGRELPINIVKTNNVNPILIFDGYFFIVYLNFGFFKNGIFRKILNGCPNGRIFCF
jgi:hypothetical protein